MSRRQKNPMRKFREDLHDLDSVARLVTGKGVGHYAKMALDLFGKQAMTLLMAGSLEAELEQDEQDLADCQMFGADNFYSERVFHFAAKFFRTNNHPDRFRPADRAQQEQVFKEGEQAIQRICEKRGWKVP